MCVRQTGLIFSSMFITMAHPIFETEFRVKLFDKYSQCQKYLIPKDVYFQTIEDMKEAAGISTTKSCNHYYILKKYEVLQCGDVKNWLKRGSHQKNVLSTMPLWKTHTTLSVKPTLQQAMVVVIGCWNILGRSTPTSQHMLLTCSSHTVLCVRRSGNAQRLQVSLWSPFCLGNLTLELK